VPGPFPRRVLLVLLVAGFLAVPGVWHLLRGAADSPLVFGDDPNLPTLTLFTSAMATTPQLAFWAAVQAGDIQKLCNLRVMIWKNLDDLRGVLLAGKGDLWLGHTEGFAQAHAANAPVRLLYISAWRKFYLVSTDPSVTSFADMRGRKLAYAPVGSSAVPILKGLLEGVDIDFTPHEPQQLAMMMISGRSDTALVPEPLVSGLLHAMPDLRVVESVEDLYGRRSRHPARMPIVGMAVNADTLEQHPEIVQGIVSAVLRHSPRVRDEPGIGIAALPEPFGAFTSKELVHASLERDIILDLPASEVRDEIKTYLDFVMPGRRFDLDGLIWNSPIATVIVDASS
jgi:NitT/TauT family transport system substrate-binding protein